ncbi:MAG: XisI protein [Deltaproteobacteria bacterium]|nr:XisI protein [Deltaproteobacteria bacterium]
MEALDAWRDALIHVLKEYAQIPYAQGEIRNEVVCDREQGHYLLMEVGWDAGQRVHGPLIHVDVIADKLWIQHDGTERGIADDLVAAGVPRDHIVLGFRPPHARKYTDFAAA